MRRTFLLPILLAIAACNLSIEDGRANFDITLGEDQVNTVVSAAEDRTDARLLDDITSLDFVEPDIVRVAGTKDGEPGTFDMTFSAEDNTIRVEVTAVDITGMELTSDEVTQLNEELSESFQESADPEGDSGVSDVRVENDQLVISVTATLDGS